MSEMVQAASIGWVGSGIMGSSMAGHLLRAGHRLRIHTRTRAKAHALLDAGAEWAQTAADAARGADFVCTSVGMPDEVEDVYFGEAGVLKAVTAGQVLIDFTTSAPSFAVRVAAAARALGASALDAPVSGGDVGARNAALSIMVGGDESCFSQAKPLLEKLGKTIVHQGAAGSGQRTKIVNQILVAANTLGNPNGDFTGQIYTIDSVHPSVTSINRTTPAGTLASTSAVFTVTFNEDVTGVDTAGFALALTGGVTGTIATVTPVRRPQARRQHSASRRRAARELSALTRRVSSICAPPQSP